ncbi:MAG: ATP-binding protein [Alphaproteobacteria bacterium]
MRHRLAARGDTEHEQALVRIAIVGLLLAYALVGPLPAPPAPWWVPTVPQVGYAIGTLSLLHFAWIVADPAVRRVRRALWSGLDHVAIVVAMAVGGEAMALLYPLLLWVTLGHGFRYGPAHLVGSALVSVLLFIPLVTLHPAWQLQGALAIGLVLGLVLIPGYCLRLLQHLHRARRRAEASSEAKSRFLATMSHELRTPLHAILGMAELLRGGALSAQQREMVRTIHSSGHGLLNMIEDLLDIARIEAGAERIDVEGFDVHRLLHEVREMLAHRAAAKGLALQLRIDPTLVGELDGPRRAVHQILINLVANAVKFTDAGHVRLEAGLRDGPTDVHLELAVVDTGCGIPPAAQAHIFERFTQVDDPKTRRPGGSGLGLAIVKRLVDGAGGTLRLDSTVGVGTRFAIALPVRVRADPPPAAASLVVVHGTPDAAKREILTAAVPHWRSAAEAADGATNATVDLWCRDASPAPPARRHGRALLVWGDGADVPDALAVLPADADAGVLRRLVRAALVPAAPALDGEPVRVHAGDRSLDVLVADDHEVNRRVIERLLTQAGHRTELVADGAAALAAVERSHFDVVVLDLNMPELDGIDVARRLTATDADRPRLIALTADATAKTREACAEAGFDAYLTKPVDGAGLLATLVGAADAAARATPPTAEPTGATVATAEVLDLNRLRMLRELGDAEFVRELVESFIADGERLVVELGEAADEGDVRRFRDAAHALRSAATHLGATALFERCLVVKSIEADTLRARAPTLRRDLAGALEATAAALRAAVCAEASPRGINSPDALSDFAPDAPSCADPGARARVPARPRAR